MTLGKSETTGKYIMKRSLPNKRAAPYKRIIKAGLLKSKGNRVCPQQTPMGLSGNNKKASVREA